MIHINLDGVHHNKIAACHHAMMLARKLEDLNYADNPYEMAPGTKRCRWVRYRIEGGSHPQHNKQNDEAPR